MKRPLPVSHHRQYELGKDLPLESELMHNRRFDRHSPIHQAIWDLAARSPSANFAQDWKGPACVDLLKECNSLDWVQNFGHIATLFGITALTAEIPGPSPELVVHLLRTCPQIIDMTLESFCADGEQIPMLHGALSETNHLRHFDFRPEDIDPGVGLSIVQGLRSHHHLASWCHWTDDDPDTIVPELAQTLSGTQSLQYLDLSTDAHWDAGHVERFARRLMQMPALRDLRLDIARESNAATCATASALIRAIATLPRLMSLCLPHHVFLAMAPTELIRAVRQNGAIDTLSFLDIHGKDVPVELSAGLAAALRTNRNRFDISSIGTLDDACSAFVDVILATQSRLPVSDIGIVLATHMVGHSTAPDLRDCQGMLRACEPVWSAARDARQGAMLKLLKLPSTTEAASLHKLHLVGLGRKYGILSVEEALRLADLHSNWLPTKSAPLQ